MPDEIANKVTVQWGHVLDELGSTDFYDSEDEARDSVTRWGGGLVRIDTTTIVPYFTPAGSGAQK